MGAGEAVQIKKRKRWDISVEEEEIYARTMWGYKMGF
jgi:hypothetical protein